MANKPKHLKPTNDEVRTAENLIKAGRAQLEPMVEEMRRKQPTLMQAHETIGGLKRGRAEREIGRLLDCVMLFKAKQNKTYREAGLTFEAFCEAAGYSERTVDSWLTDLQSVMDQFSASWVDLLGLTFNEIKLLGRINSAGIAEIKGDVIEYKGQKFPLKDARPVLEDMAEDLRKTKSEADHAVKAAKRVLRDKEAVIQKQAKDLERYAGRARAKDLTPEEDGFLSQMETLKVGFDGYMLQADPARIEELQAGDGAAVTPRMRAAYLETLGYMRRQVVAAYDTAVEMYGHDMSPDEGWRPGSGGEG